VFEQALFFAALRRENKDESDGQRQTGAFQFLKLSRIFISSRLWPGVRDGTLSSRRLNCFFRPPFHAG
jgi:hypothetical protein